jgi:hypothetical protein
MRSEDLPEHLDAPLFSAHAKLSELERQLYGHVIEAVDWDMLHALDQYLYAVLRKRNIGHELATDIADQLIERSLHRAADDQVRFGPTSIPFGITDEERRAAAVEEGCPFCDFEAKLAAQAKQDEAKPPQPGEGQEEECCPLCDDMAAEWREEHAEALAKAGLSPPPAHDHDHAKRMSS